MTRPYPGTLAQHRPVRTIAQVRAEMRDRLADARTLLPEDVTRLRDWIEALDAEIAIREAA